MQPVEEQPNGALPVRGGQTNEKLSGTVDRPKTRAVTSSAEGVRSMAIASESMCKVSFNVLGIGLQPSVH